MLLDLFFSHFFLFLHPVHMACGFCPLSKRVTLCAEGSSTGAASASTSANTAALPPGFSAANFPTGTTVGSAGGPFNRCCLGPNKCSCHSHKCHHCSPSSKCCPSCPSCQRCSLFKRPQCRWLHSRDIESHYAWLCPMDFHRATSIEAGARVANGAGIVRTKASKCSRCPLMPPLKVHHSDYRGEPRGCDCTCVCKNHPTAWHNQFDIISFSQGTACRQILWSDGPWTGWKIPHGKTITNHKSTRWLQHVRNMDWRSCAFWRRSHLLRFRPLLRPRRHLVAASNIPRHKAEWVHKNRAAWAYDDELGQCKSDLCEYPTGHSRA